METRGWTDAYRESGHAVAGWFLEHAKDHILKLQLFLVEQHFKFCAVCPKWQSFDDKRAAYPHDMWKYLSTRGWIGDYEI
jgi:hypothetical protein